MTEHNQSMSMNFSSKDLYTQIESSCVSADNHTVENLISDDTTKRAKGFQGEAFVRAPVTIKVSLALPITIHKVDVTPWIGQQCAKVIKIYAATLYSQRKNNEHKFTQDNKNLVFKEVGSAFLTQKHKICFINAGYKPNTACVSSELVNGTLINLKGYLQNITTLKIAISYMLLGSIPSIGSLDVWGRPTQATKPDPLRDHIISKYNKTLSQTADQEQSCSTAHDLESTSVENLIEPANEIKCPQEFLDPLTCEVMRVPTLLPCGHTVDRTTLDKHVQAQTELGNIPSDPFTGIPFTENSKPQPNVLLKMRMDNFNYRNLQRNLNGSIPNSVAPVNLLKRLSNQETKHFKKRKTVNLCAILPQSFTASKSPTKSSSASSHEVVLKKSLNEALQKTLNGQRKQRVLSESGETSSNLYCAMCTTFLTSSAVQYQLPCEHILCNKCMRKPKNICLRCPSCLITFKSESVERIYS